MHYRIKSFLVLLLFLAWTAPAGAAPPLVSIVYSADSRGWHQPCPT